MTVQRIDLTTGPIHKHLIRLTIPMIWGIAAIISYQLVDTYYISLLGTTPLAALSFTFPVTFFVFCITMGFGISMSSVVSRLIGEKKEAEVRRVVFHGLVLVFCVVGALSLATFFFVDPLFAALGATAELRPVIYDYMGLWLIGAPIIALPFVGNSAMRASGDTLTPALIMIASAVLNAALSPLFIFGLAGFPRMEVQGAALGTVIANIFAMIAGLYVLAIRLKMIPPLSQLNFKEFRDSVRRLMFIAMAAGLTAAIGPLVNMVIVSLLADFGKEAVAAYGIATRIEAFAFVILMALAVGMAPLIGQNYGARQYLRVHETLNLAIGFSVVWCIGIAALLMALSEPVARIFASDPIVAYYTALAFMVIAPSYLFTSLVSGWSSAFNAMGKPQISFAMTVIKMGALMIPAVHFGAQAGGVFGVFAAIALVNIVCGFSFHLWSRRYCALKQAALAQPV